MNNTLRWMTAQTPSAFGMPISGHAFAADTCALLVDVQGTAVSTAVIERDRVAGIAGTTGAVAADKGLAQSYFPGTTAWRPPTC